MIIIVVSDNEDVLRSFMVNLTDSNLTNVYRVFDQSLLIPSVILVFPTRTISFCAFTWAEKKETISVVSMHSSVKWIASRELLV